MSIEGVNASLELYLGEVVVVASPFHCCIGVEYVLTKVREVLFDYHPGWELRGFLGRYGLIDCVQRWVVWQTFPVEGMQIRMDVLCCLLSPPTAVGAWSGRGVHD